MLCVDSHAPAAGWQPWYQGLREAISRPVMQVCCMIKLLTRAPVSSYEAELQFLCVLEKLMERVSGDCRHGDDCCIPAATAR